MATTTYAHNRLNLVGHRYGDLTVLESAGTKVFGKTDGGTKSSMWLCRCDCGKEKVISGQALRSGNSKTCGCGIVRSTIARGTTHGMTNTRAYRIWQAMLTRCKNPNAVWYVNYGGRGIKVCDRWSEFENFYSDMGDPGANLSIDRIDNDGNYEPDNCKWSTKHEQGRNTRRTRMITFNGVTQCLKDWAIGLNMDQASLRERLEKWPLEKALTTPKGRK